MTEIKNKSGIQEKNLPTQPIDSPKLKKLVIGLAGFAVLAILVYSIFLWWRGRDNFTEARDKVVDALEKKDEKTLAILANKEFLVGQPESDNAATVDPAQVIPKILQLTTGTKWSDRYQDFENIRILYPEAGSFQLMFLKSEKSWIWSGFLAVNPEDLAALASQAPATSEKIEYKEIHTDEAKGDEPALTD